MSTFRRIAAFVCLLSTAAPVLAQEPVRIEHNPAAEAIFQEAVILFNNGKYAEAESRFAELIDMQPPHQRITAALIMHARTSYWLGNYRRAQEDIRDLLKLYPNTRYRADAHLIMGLIHFRNGEVYRAAKQLVLAYQTSAGRALGGKSRELAFILLTDYLTPEQLQQLKSEGLDEAGHALIVLAEAHHYLQRNDPVQAQALVEKYLEVHPDSRLAADLTSLLRDHILKVLNVNRVGVLLPLSGVYAEEGRRVAAGIKFAEQQVLKSRDGAVNVETVFRDTGSNMIQAIKEAQALLDDPNVICLIGELEDLITAGLAGVANARKTPFLAPIASDNGLSGIGPYVFQVSPDLESRARALARHAILVDSLRTFITIAPHDEYGQQMVDAFSEEVDRLGGEIITQRWYFGVPENLGRQFKEIREIAFRRMLEDTLRPKIPNFAALNKDSLWNDFVRRFMLETKSTESIVDQNSAYPVTNIDGVFLPIYQEDIEYVARQLRYFNINARIYGGEYWYISDLDKNKQLLRYVDGAVFASSYYYDPSDLAYITFRDRFRQAMGVTPEKWELVGYDTAGFLFSLLDGKKISRTAMHERLLTSRAYQGRKGAIAFDAETRVNRAVHLLQIRGTRIVPLTPPLVQESQPR